MRRIVSFAIVGVLVGLVTVVESGTSLATAPSGFGANFTYRATLDPFHSTSGWHSHPGPVFVIVVQGTATKYSAGDPSCTGHQVPAGQGFVELPGDVHIIRNEGTTRVVTEVTLFGVPVGGSFRPDAPRPGSCAF